MQTRSAREIITAASRLDLPSQTPLNKIRIPLLQEAIAGLLRKAMSQNTGDPYRTITEEEMNWLGLTGGLLVELRLSYTTKRQKAATYFDIRTMEDMSDIELFDVLFPQKWHNNFPPCPFTLAHLEQVPGHNDTE